MSSNANALITAFRHLQANYKFQTASYILYVYDHFLTLPEEVDKIWAQPFTFATLLFYINRYVTHGQFIIIQAEFYETNWPIAVCDRYVKFAGATTLCLVAVVEIILILRVYALYLGNKKVLTFLLTIWTGQVIASAWAIRGGVRVPLPAGFPGCVLTGSDNSFAALWAAPLVTDTCIFVLTLYRTLNHKRQHGSMRTMDIILRDGILYFLAIFSVNLMNTLIYFLAVEDLKALGASFSQILTSIAINRLQLNLRRATSAPPTLSSFQGKIGSYSGNTSGKSKTVVATDHQTTFFTIGNLGEDLVGTFFEKPVEEDEVIKDLHPKDGEYELHILSS